MTEEVVASCRFDLPCGISSYVSRSNECYINECVNTDLVNKQVYSYISMYI